MPLEVLDLYCGLGGWSKGFATEGFNPTGVDIIDVGYPFKLILSDVRELEVTQYQGYDIIVGSPPCRDFSQMAYFGKVMWKEPPNPIKGMELVNAFLRIVDDVKPKYWLMENVPGLIKYLDLKPKMIVYLTANKRRAFWGEFPLFLISKHWWDRHQIDKAGKLRPWLRAEIPFGTSQPLAQAIKRELLKET